MSYSSCSCFCLLDRTIHICVPCFRAVKIWCFEYNSLILTTGCSTWHLMAKNSLRIWELELLLSTKMAEAIRSSVTAWNWVTVQWPGSYRCFPRRVSLGTGLARVIKEVESLCCASGAEAGFKKQMHECCQHCFRGCRSGRSACQCSDHTPHTQQVGLHGRRPRRKPLLKLAHKKACKQFAEDNLSKSMNYWNHVLWSDESKVNLFDSDGVQYVWWRPGQEYQENGAMVWGCMTTAGTGELRFTEGNMDSNMYCDILKQKMMPSLQKLFSNITTTPNTLSRWLLPCCWRWRWWSGQVCLQTWTLLSTCGASSSGRWRSTMCLTASSSVMSLWRSGRGSSNNLCSSGESMPRRIKAVLDNNGALQNIDNLDTVLTCSLRVSHFCCQLFGQ